MTPVGRAGPMFVTAADREAEAIPAMMPMIAGDLNAPAPYARKRQGVTTVIHLAAKVGNAPLAEHQWANAAGTRSLVQACQVAGVERFVHVSSMAAAHPDNPFYHYAASKGARKRNVVFSLVPRIGDFNAPAPAATGIVANVEAPGL